MATFCHFSLTFCHFSGAFRAFRYDFANLALDIFLDPFLYSRTLLRKKAAIYEYLAAYN